MKSALSMIALGVALAATCATPGTVHAEDAADSPGSSNLKLGSKTVSLDVLDGQRGGTDAHLTETRLSKVWADGSMNDVRVGGVASGDNVVSTGSLAGASGMPMLIQNSGIRVEAKNPALLSNRDG